MPEKNKRTRAIIILMGYPIAILTISTLINMFAFGVNAPIVALPALSHIYALIIAAILLLINHTWLMTSTELTRTRFKLYATPEEWAASGTSPHEAQEDGLREVERRHNTHRNTTENVIYFIFLVFVFVLISPTHLAGHIWIILFPSARLGYTYSYLAGKASARGLFMSLSLLALYGIASYLLISLVI